MRRIIWFCLVTICTFLTTANPLQAGLMYQLADSTGAPTTSFTISGVGGIVDVKVYLKEDVGGILLSTEELLGASAKITYGSPSGIAEVSSLGDIMPNADFVTLLYPPPSFGATEAGFTGDVGLLPNPFLSPDMDNRIYLGTFRFTGSSAGTVAIAVMDRDPTPDDTVSGRGTEWDSVIADASGSITVLGSGGVEPVPEPSTLCLLCLGGLGLAGWRWRRQRAPN